MTKKHHYSLFLYALSCLFLIIQFCYFMPRMPEKMATHFDLKGIPNGWQMKESFMMFYPLFLGVLILSILGFSLGIKKIPTSLINIPGNKDLLFSPERKENTYKVVQSYLIYIGFMTNLLLLWFFQQVFMFNQGGQESLQGTGVAISIYILAYILLSIMHKKKLKTV